MSVLDVDEDEDEDEDLARAAAAAKESHEATYASVPSSWLAHDDSWSAPGHRDAEKREADREYSVLSASSCASSRRSCDEAGGNVSGGGVASGGAVAAELGRTWRRQREPTAESYDASLHSDGQCKSQRQQQSQTREAARAADDELSTHSAVTRLVRDARWSSLRPSRTHGAARMRMAVPAQRRVKVRCSERVDSVRASMRVRPHTRR